MNKQQIQQHECELHGMKTTSQTDTHSYYNMSYDVCAAEDKQLGSKLKHRLQQ
jgi:hypothetical protein